MTEKLFHIRINEAEDNRDAGFLALMASGASVLCLNNEEYLVPEKAMEDLNDKNIVYDLVVKEEAFKQGERKNAAKT